MKTIRAATQEEIAAIEKTAELDASCIVLALDTPKGVATAVIRVATEVDPIDYPAGLDDRYKLMFGRDIETFLLAKGVSKYFFNIHADEAAAPWRKVMETWGAEATSTAPEIRFRKHIG